MYKKEEEDNSIKVEPAHVIEIYNGEKNLTIDFEGDTVEVSGTLEVSEAAKIFIDSISLYFHDKFIEKEKVKEAIRDLYSDVRGMQVNTDIGFTLCPIETLQRIKKLYRELTITPWVCSFCQESNPDDSILCRGCFAKRDEESIFMLGWRKRNAGT